MAPHGLANAIGFETAGKSSLQHKVLEAETLSQVDRMLTGIRTQQPSNAALPSRRKYRVTIVCFLIDLVICVRLHPHRRSSAAAPGRRAPAVIRDPRQDRRHVERANSSRRRLAQAQGVDA